MPLERFYRLPEDKRSHLLRVAAAEFADKGFDGASLNAILASAGLSKGSYYYYFTDKEDLYAEAFERVLDVVTKDLPVFRPDEVTRATFWPAADRYFRECLRVARRAPEYLQLARGLSSARRQSPRFAAMFARFSELYASMLERGRALGCIRTDLPTSLLMQLIGALDAVLDEYLFTEHPEPSEQAMVGHGTLVFDTVRRVLEPQRHDTKRRKP